MAIQSTETRETKQRGFSPAADDESQVRQVLDELAQAFNSKNLEKIMECYAPDIVAFDMMPPLRYVGREAYKKAWQKGFDMMGGPFKYELSELDITVRGDIAVCHSLNHTTGTDKDGKDMDIWARWTGCLSKQKGKWLIVHEHFSVPIDVKTNQALFDLKPDSDVTH